jgi:hypothetical protein
MARHLALIELIQKSSGPAIGAAESIAGAQMSRVNRHKLISHGLLVTHHVSLLFLLKFCGFAWKISPRLSSNQQKARWFSCSATIPPERYFAINAPEKARAR